jgi:hypothetical protein
MLLYVKYLANVSELESHKVVFNELYQETKV